MGAISYVNQFSFFAKIKYNLQNQCQYIKKRKLYKLGLCLLFVILVGGCSEDESDSDVDPPTAKITISTEMINAGEEVTFTNASTGQVDQIEWTFEGGNISNSNAPVTTVLYQNEGNFKATLRVSNSGGSDTTEQIIQVNEVISNNVKADFLSNAQRIAIGSEVSFFDSSTGTPNQWSWTFSGGTPINSTEQNPKIIYNILGTYAVTLEVRNDNSSDTEIKENYITVYEPTQADFDFDVNEVTQGGEVRFTDRSVSADQWNWTFPGGTPETSAERNPVVTYNTPGIYSVTLETRNDNSLDTEIKENIIMVLPAPDLQSDLVGHYKFDTDATNEVDPNNPGILQGNPSFVADRKGNSNAAISFNGTSTYVNYINPIPGPDYTGDLTYSFWINIANINTESTIIGLFSSKSAIDIRNVNDQIEYKVVFRGNGAASTSQTEIVKATISDNSWIHIAIRHASADAFEIFVNNQLSGREQITRTQIFERSENSYMAAKDISGSEDQHYEGFVDDLRIYTRALTNEEIKLLFEE
ncbi:PKD domain-containing protein [uncultured Aquimarina sp.]|uniref:PKD domain-containing protein n=1 Tax=uncultured Aquimarina sp. TaxID=575652 RepID=UPI00262A8935|nr:PKD domain-containing protein [uncultured Aquimarina sp.]